MQDVPVGYSCPDLGCDVTLECPPGSAAIKVQRIRPVLTGRGELGEKEYELDLERTFLFPVHLLRVADVQLTTMRTSARRGDGDESRPRFLVKPEII